MFELYDENNDGELQVEELKNLHANLGEPITVEESQKMMKGIDQVGVTLLLLSTSIFVQHNNTGTKFAIISSRKVGTILPATTSVVPSWRAAERSVFATAWIT